MPPAKNSIRSDLLLHKPTNSGEEPDFFWDAILGADLARDFKPKPIVYRSAVDAFNLDAHECMMCAAHSDDLEAASSMGLRTCFIARPNEQPGVSETAPGIPVDAMANGVEDLAAQLGA
jgi:2-haloacid dehalogenase